jgi:replication factor A2
MDYQGGDSGGFGVGAYGGGASEDPPSSAGKTRKSYDEQTVIPVTIRMINRSRPDTAGGDGSVTLEDGRKLAMVKLVATARSVEDHSTNIVYSMEDGTGLIEVKQWHDDNQCTALQEIRQETSKEHVYVKVIGQIKDYERNKIIVASSVRSLSTANELTHHMLDVVYSAERYKRADGFATKIPISSGIGFGGPKVSAGDGDHPLRKAVLHLFKNGPDNGQGIHVDVAITDLKGSYPEADIRKAIDALSEEGLIYSTVSDDHFQFAQ